MNTDSHRKIHNLLKYPDRFELYINGSKILTADYPFIKTEKFIKTQDITDRYYIDSTKLIDIIVMQKITVDEATKQITVKKKKQSKEPPFNQPYNNWENVR